MFHPTHRNEAIWRFRDFDRAGLNYLAAGHIDPGEEAGLWDRAFTAEIRASSQLTARCSLGHASI